MEYRIIELDEGYGYGYGYEIFEDDNIIAKQTFKPKVEGFVIMTEQEAIDCAIENISDIENERQELSQL